MKRVVLAVLVACGTPDPDIPEPDGPFVPGPVSIAITNRGAPAVNVPVIFQNADSTVVLSTVTDFDGKAGADLEGDGFVTVHEPREASAPRAILTTFAGVQGGDELHLDLAPLGRTDVAEFQLLIEPDGGADALGGHRVLSPCGPFENFAFVGDPAPPTGQLVGCGSETDLLVVSLDEFGEPLRSRFHPAIALTGTQTLTGSYVAFENALLEYLDIPGEVSFVGAYRAFARESGIVFDVTAGVTPDATSGEVSIKMPAMGGDIAIASTTPFPAAGELGSQLVLDWEAAAGGDYMLDLGAAMLPRYTEPPRFEIARRTATWAEADAETQPDTVRIRLMIHRPEIPTGTTWEWRMIGERSGASVTYPLLPIDDATGFDFNPNPIDIVTIPELTTAKLPAGYDKTARERGFIQFKDMRSGTSGRIVTQDRFFAEPAGEPEL